MPIGAQSGFAVAFQEFVFYAGPTIQLLFWVVLSAVAVYAVLLFKRLVDHRTGVVPAAAGPGASAAPHGETVNVEEFVE